MTKPTFADKFLPVQHEFRHLFEGGPEEHMRALYEQVANWCDLTDPVEELGLKTTPKFTLAEMGSSPHTLRLLQFLVRLKAPKRALEIGAFIGVSGIHIAAALPPGGKLVTIEKFDHFAEIAQANFDASGLADRIELRLGDALELLDDLAADGKFDMIFLDGNKENYADYFEALDPLLAPGGLVITDDVLFHGDALNQPPRTEKGAGTRRFLDVIKARDDYFKILLPLSNGIYLAQKR